MDYCAQCRCSPLCSSAALISIEVGTLRADLGEQRRSLSATAPSICLLRRLLAAGAGIRGRRGLVVRCLHPKRGRPARQPILGKLRSDTWKTGYEEGPVDRDHEV